MKVVILCGGQGTRLREETEFRPKPMVNIGGRPILWHIMKLYSHYGFHDFILALGYKGEIIKHYFCNYELMNSDVTLELGKPGKMILRPHNEVGWKIILADTGEKTLKGGRLKKVEKYLCDDIFMLTYGDGIADINLRDLLEFHQSHGKMATVTGISPTSRFGELKIRGGNVLSFREKPKNNGSLVNGGFFVLNKKILDLLTVSDECDLEAGIMEGIARRGELMVYKHSGFWACMDTIRDMDYLNSLWDEGKAEWRVW